MADILEKMIRCINCSKTDIKAEYAFKSDMLKRAVTDKTAYFKVNHINFNVVDFTIFVYTPVFEKGVGCIETSKRVCKILSEGGFDISEMTVEGVEYNGSSQGFVSKIKGSVCDNNEEFQALGGCLFRASGFAGDRNLELEFSAESYEILGDMNEYPIMTILDDEPLEVLHGNGAFTIKLNGVLRKYAKLLSYNGMFVLRFLNMIDTGVSAYMEDVFEYCTCESVEYTAENKINLKIRGYSEYGR